MDDAIVGPGYLDTLDTIPEDVSVAAAALQHPTPRSVTNLSTASAVASSDSECDDDDDAAAGGGIEVPEEDHSRNVLSGNWRKKKDNDKMTGKKSKRRAKRPRQGSGTPIFTTGATIFGGSGGGGDAFSDTHASLGGVGDSLDRQSKPSEEAPKPGAATSIFCRKRAFLFYSVIAMLLVAIGVGIYFIVTKVSNISNSDTSEDAEGNSVFPPYQLEGESFFPSAAPSYNQEDVADLDAVLRSIPGVDANKLNNKSTPEGQCRHWMAHSDALELRADIVGEKRIEQRYILCLLYYYTNGDNWIIEPWLNGDLHECDWYGITCSANDVVAVELDKKNLTGSIPASIESLSTLHFLSLQDNAISGNIPEGIFDILPDLKWLDLSNNALTGNIPSLEDDSVSSTLEVLYIKGNQLEGTLPFFPNLQRLRAQRNLLTSMDERYASSAESLVYLYAYDNQLAGSLPSKWNTPNLQILDLGFNNLEGAIPQDLWDLPSLLKLIVDNNQLTGTLPESSSSNTLTQVWLNNNLLNGTIPFTFGDNWSNLTSLKLQENDLTGTVSKDQCSIWPLSGSESSGWEFESDCNLDSMQCECCTQCYPTARLRYLRADVALIARSDFAHATNVHDDEPSSERLDGFLVTEHDAHR